MKKILILACIVSLYSCNNSSKNDETSIYADETVLIVNYQIENMKRLVVDLSLLYQVFGINVATDNPNSIVGDVSFHGGTPVFPNSPDEMFDDDATTLELLQPRQSISSGSENDDGKRNLNKIEK